MEHKGIYSWEYLKKTCFDAIDAEWQQAKNAASKASRDYYDYRQKDIIANSESEYVLLKFNQEHPELVETYEEYVKLYKAYRKADNYVDSCERATFSDWWDPQGTVGGAIAANNLMSSAIKERDALKKEVDGLGIENLVNEYQNEYYQLNKTRHGLYKHPKVLDEKWKIYAELDNVCRGLSKKKKPRKLDKVEEFKNDESLISELNEKDFIDLINTMENTVKELYPYDSWEMDVENINIETNLEYDYDEETDEEQYDYLGVQIETKGTYSGDYGKFHVSGYVEECIELPKEKTVGDFVNEFLAIAKQCDEKMCEDEGVPYERDEY